MDGCGQCFENTGSYASHGKAAKIMAKATKIDLEHRDRREHLKNSGIGNTKQVEKDKEINDIFQLGRKRKRNDRNSAEITLSVVKVMIEFEVAAQEDADLNRHGKPTINKLKMLSLFTDVLLEKQQEFLDNGLLTVLKKWLEPLLDGSLPNLTIRTKVLKILNDIDLEHRDRREHLKNSGIGNV
ncbi:hypothetical protein V8G54_017206 [Vigna mungo]|uniref:TFIIS N-terminal domain-containing protein n=1 Tax=Vigna mungo TaxID=3915 RepID=A0AAQ3S1W0_VIGMU